MPPMLDLDKKKNKTETKQKQKKIFGTSGIFSNFVLFFLDKKNQTLAK